MYINVHSDQSFLVTIIRMCKLSTIQLFNFNDLIVLMVAETALMMEYA